MNSPRFIPEFKEEAVRQIVGLGYSVDEVSERLGVSTHSLYKWVKAVKPDKTDEQAADLLTTKTEILKLTSQLNQVVPHESLGAKGCASPVGISQPHKLRNDYWASIRALTVDGKPGSFASTGILKLSICMAKVS